MESIAICFIVGRHWEGVIESWLKPGMLLKPFVTWSLHLLKQSSNLSFSALGRSPARFPRLKLSVSVVKKCIHIHPPHYGCRRWNEMHHATPYITIPSLQFGVHKWIQKDDLLWFSQVYTSPQNSCWGHMSQTKTLKHSPWFYHGFTQQIAEALFTSRNFWGSRRVTSARGWSKPGWKMMKTCLSSKVWYLSNPEQTNTKKKTVVSSCVHWSCWDDL